jgi:hypothetical protein
VHSAQTVALRLAHAAAEPSQCQPRNDKTRKIGSLGRAQSKAIEKHILVLNGVERYLLEFCVSFAQLATEHGKKSMVFNTRKEVAA